MSQQLQLSRLPQSAGEQEAPSFPSELPPAVTPLHRGPATSPRSLVSHPVSLVAIDGMNAPQPAALHCEGRATASATVSAIVSTDTLIVWKLHSYCPGARG